MLAWAALFLLPVESYATAGRAEGLAEGAGTWVNMWNYPDSDLESYCMTMHANGLRNLFVQTSRSNTKAIVHPEKLGLLIDACHHYKIRVIAWSFAELADPETDADKLIEAARFLSPKGERVDAVAANLEKNLESASVEAYSKRLRHELGADYPIIAVVYSPLNKAPQVAQTPWKLLDRYYNVIAPMNYWNGKYKKFDPTQYTLSTIRKIRELIGRPDVEIHVIGDGMGTSPYAVEQFLKACRQAEATSASLYPDQRITTVQLAALSHYSDNFPANSRFRLAAFRELLNNGGFQSINIADPSKPIKRGEFFRLVYHQLSPPHSMAQLTAVNVVDVLKRIGVLPSPFYQEISEETLNQPIDSREAISLIANLVEFKATNRHFPKISHGGNRLVPDRVVSRTHNRHAQSWFGEPAFAATSNSQGSTDNSHTFTYMDAAQIVLQASSAAYR